MNTAPTAGSPWPWIVFSLWLGSAALGFLYFELRDQRTFESDTVTLFDVNARSASAEAWFRSQLPAGTGHVVATVVHVYKAGCGCNKFTEPHLAKIVARYRQEGVRFVVATREPTAHVSSIGGLPQYE